MTAVVHWITGQAGCSVQEHRQHLGGVSLQPQARSVGNRVEMYWSKKRCNLRSCLGFSESFISSSEKFIFAIFLTVVIVSFCTAVCANLMKSWRDSWYLEVQNSTILWNKSAKMSIPPVMVGSYHIIKTAWLFSALFLYVVKSHSLCVRQCLLIANRSRWVCCMLAPVNNLHIVPLI